MSFEIFCYNSGKNFLAWLIFGVASFLAGWISYQMRYSNKLTELKNKLDKYNSQLNKEQKK